MKMTLNESEKYIITYLTSISGRPSADQLKRLIQNNCLEAFKSKEEHSNNIEYAILSSFYDDFNDKLQHLNDDDIEKLIQDALISGSLLDDDPLLITN